MADDIKIRIGLEGDADIKKKLDNISDHGRKFGQDISKSINQAVGTNPALGKAFGAEEGIERSREAAERFREVLHTLHPILGAAGLELGNLGAFARVAGAGMGALGVAVVGSLLVGLAKIAEQADRTGARLKALTGSDFANKNLSARAKDLGTSPDKLAPFAEQEEGFVQGRRAVQDVSGGVSHPPGFQPGPQDEAAARVQILNGRGAIPGGPQSSADVAKFTDTLLQAARIDKTPSEEARAGVSALEQSTFKSGRVTPADLDAVNRISPSIGKEIAKAFSGSAAQGGLGRSFQNLEEVKASPQVANGQLSIDQLIAAVNKASPAIKERAEAAPPGITESLEHLEASAKRAAEALSGDAGLAGAVEKFAKGLDQTTGFFDRHGSEIKAAAGRGAEIGAKLPIPGGSVLGRVVGAGVGTAIGIGDEITPPAKAALRKTADLVRSEAERRQEGAPDKTLSTSDILQKAKDYYSPGSEAAPATVIPSPAAPASPVAATPIAPAAAPEKPVSAPTARGAGLFDQIDRRINQQPSAPSEPTAAPAQGASVPQTPPLGYDRTSDGLLIKQASPTAAPVEPAIGVAPPSPVTNGPRSEAAPAPAAASAAPSKVTSFIETATSVLSKATAALPAGRTQKATGESAAPAAPDNATNAPRSDLGAAPEEAADFRGAGTAAGVEAPAAPAIPATPAAKPEFEYIPPPSLDERRQLERDRLQPPLQPLSPQPPSSQPPQQQPSNTPIRSVQADQPATNGQRSEAAEPAQPEKLASLGSQFVDFIATVSAALTRNKDTTITDPVAIGIRGEAEPEQPVASAAKGGRVVRMAEGGEARLDVSPGGRLSGPGTGTSDSIDAKVSNKEFVVNAEDTANNLGLLHDINSGKVKDGHYVGGGQVHPPSSDGTHFADGGQVKPRPTPDNLGSLSIVYDPLSGGAYINGVLHRPGDPILNDPRVKKGVEQSKAGMKADSSSQKSKDPFVGDYGDGRETGDTGNTPGFAEGGLVGRFADGGYLRRFANGGEVGNNSSSAIANFRERVRGYADGGIIDVSHFADGGYLAGLTDFGPAPSALSGADIDNIAPAPGGSPSSLSETPHFGTLDLTTQFGQGRVTGPQELMRQLGIYAQGQAMVQTGPAPSWATR